MKAYRNGSNGEQSKDDVKLGRFLSLVLRHNPGAAKIKLDEHGYADVDQLLSGVKRAGWKIDRDILERIVKENNKNRYSFNEDGSKIRANQGHSLNVDIGLQQQVPPDILYHGTASHAVDSIRAKGIVKGTRQHVHLSHEVETARKVGSRHGKPAVLTINASAMHADGLVFYQSANGVWLCDHVPWKYVM
ncbi:RNA 2'-phosphotransferase [compost metagenome]